MKPSEALKAVNAVIKIAHFVSPKVRAVLQDIMDGKHDDAKPVVTAPKKEAEKKDA